MELNSRRQFIESSEQLPTYSTSPPFPPRTIQDFDPLYEEQDVKLLFNWYPRIQVLPQEELKVITSYRFYKYTGTSSTRYGQNRSYRNFEGYHWLVKTWPEINTHASIQARYCHFLKVNVDNPYLKGENHNDRFIRGTKLLITKGEFEGKHCVVVGHQVRKEFFSGSPSLRVLLPDHSIATVPQKNTYLLDLHGYLPFAVPFDPLHPTTLSWAITPGFWQHQFTNQFTDLLAHYDELEPEEQFAEEEQEE